MALYHKDIGFPKELVTRLGSIKLQYSAHAEHAAATDRYGDIDLPFYLHTEDADVHCIEAEIEAGVVQKLVYRMPYDAQYDLIIALGRNGIVRTVWFNDKSDKHSTLRAEKYARP